jgi:hypothetical protein
VPEELFEQSRVYDPYSKDNTFVWDIDRDVLQGYIDRFVAGEWPQPSSNGEATCPPPQEP